MLLLTQLLGLRDILLYVSPLPHFGGSNKEVHNSWPDNFICKIHVNIVKVVFLFPKLLFLLSFRLRIVRVFTFLNMAEVQFRGSFVVLAGSLFKKVEANINSM
jgi:hypothetical protein